MSLNVLIERTNSASNWKYLDTCSHDHYNSDRYLLLLSAYITDTLLHAEVLVKDERSNDIEAMCVGAYKTS